MWKFTVRLPCRELNCKPRCLQEAGNVDCFEVQRIAHMDLLTAFTDLAGYQIKLCYGDVRDTARDKSTSGGQKQESAKIICMYTPFGANDNQDRHAAKLLCL